MHRTRLARTTAAWADLADFAFRDVCFQQDPPSIYFGREVLTYRDYFKAKVYTI